MDNDPKQEEALETLFDAARADTPATAADFVARLAEDAAAAMPRPMPAAPMSARSIQSRLKGLFAACGLTGATAFGVWIGFVMPETLNTLADGFAGDQTVSLSSFLPGADLLALSE